MDMQPPLSKRWRTFATCLAILVAMTAVPAVSAQSSDSESVTVTANIVSPPDLVLTLCDLTADFGSGLDNAGAAPTGATDVVTATTQGTDPNQGVYYRWTPSCASGTTFFRIESAVPWALHACATQTASTSSLAIAQNDLVFRPSSVSDYASVIPSRPFTPCPASMTSPWLSAGLGTTVTGFYYLRVDDDDTAGSFNATTIWTVIP